MAAGRIIFPGMMPAVDSNGDAVPGALAHFYQNATTTLGHIFVDNTLTTELSNPVVADASGVWPPMWADSATLFTVSLAKADGTPLPASTWSAVSAAIDATLASSDIAESAKIAAQASATASAASASAAATTAATLNGLTSGNFGGLSLSNIGQITVLAGPTQALQVATKAYVDSTAFAMAAGQLPGQGGNAGKFITTNGSVTSWGTAVTAGAGLATVTGNVVAVGHATAGDIRAGNSVAAMTSGDTYGALAEVTLTDVPGGTVALDMSTFVDAYLPFSGTSNTRVLGNPTNPKVGQSGWIRPVQSSGGANGMSFASNWKRQGGAGSLTQVANATDILEYQVITPTFILYDIKANPS